MCVCVCITFDLLLIFFKCFFACEKKIENRKQKTTTFNNTLSLC